MQGIHNSYIITTTPTIITTTTTIIIMIMIMIMTMIMIIIIMIIVSLRLARRSQQAYVWWHCLSSLWEQKIAMISVVSVEEFEVCRDYYGNIQQGTQVVLFSDNHYHTHTHTLTSLHSYEKRRR